MKGVMHTEACDLGGRLLTLLTEPKPDEHEHQDMCRRMPQFSDEDGPMWVKTDWMHGYKLWVGHFPSSISKASIGQYCDGQVDISVISVQRGQRPPHWAYAIVAFTDVALAIKAFEQLATTNFDVKWFRKR